MKRGKLSRSLLLSGIVLFQVLPYAKAQIETVVLGINPNVPGQKYQTGTAYGNALSVSAASLQ